MKAILKRVVPQPVRRVIRDSAEMIQYATPDPLFRQDELTDRGMSWFKQLKNHGIVKIEGDAELLAVAEYLDSTYFQKIETDPTILGTEKKTVYPFGDSIRFVHDENNDSVRNAGTEISCSISFRDPACAPLFLNQDAIAAVGAYYRRQPYYRNQPLIQKIVPKNVGVMGNGSMHVEHLHQVSFMQLVSDVFEKDTHMEYCLGSNKRNLMAAGVELQLPVCAELATPYPKFQCVGKRGTLFIFDTIGFHRAVYMGGSTRKMLHLNITTGHHLGRFIDSRAAFSELDSKPPFVRKMFRFLG